VQLLARDNADGSFHVVASGTIPAVANSNTKPPIGWIDVANRTVISGWAFDADNGAISVRARIDIDGFAGAPFTANTARPDLTAAPSVGSPNHGFSRSIAALSNAAHSVALYVEDDDGTYKLVATSTIPAILPPPSGGAVGGGGTTTTLRPVTRIAQSFFDSAYYLARNADVAAAISQGSVSSAWSHFLSYGQFERRRPSALYDETYYLKTNPDIAAAVTRGTFKTAFDHFVNYGFAEGRKGAA
jgi:hypothetical protein